MSKDWNHAPDLPLTVNPLFRWPLDPWAVLKWYGGAWLFLTVNSGIVALSFVAYWWFSPTLETAATPGLWMAGVLLRNLVILTALAGGLHLWFHHFKMQGQDKKYDPRPFPRKGRVFTFDHQLLDNMVWALASGVPIWSAFECLIWWSMANGYAPVITFAQAPVWFILFFFLIPIWESLYFYWIHRILHTDLFYRFHALHHRNTDVGPWSGLSMHPVEHVFYFGTAMIHFVVPSHPVHLICHLFFYALYAVITHTGFEGLWLKGQKRVHLGMFHHQMHHRYFECNYGTLEVPWDTLFGTFHDGTDAGRQMMRNRKRRTAN